MRDNIKKLVSAFSSAFDVPQPVVEIGSYQVPGQEGYADLRPFFGSKQFIGCDMRPGTGVDRIEDVHRLSFQDGEVGTVLSADTLEHVENPFQALAEMHRVLRPGGLLLITSVMDFPIHDYPSDYWRFTPEAFRLLMRPFASCVVGFEGNPEKPHTVVGLAAKGEMPRKALQDFARLTGFITYIPKTGQTP